MNSKYLVVNAGSSSLKFSLYEMPEEKEVINGYIEKIGLEGSSVQIKIDGKKEMEEIKISNFDEATKLMIHKMIAYKAIDNVEEIKGVGHRVAHGGEIYSQSVIINEKVLNDIEDLKPFAPLHHPGQVTGINACKSNLPNAKMVAVFDTAYHQTMPEVNFLYAVPREWYKKHGVRKYGFHGTSHRYITETMQQKLNKEDVNLIICHIGSGASISAIKSGKCLDTSMGFTPLAGLVMGTRSGDIDPSIIPYIMEKEKENAAEVITDLNKKSGLVGLTGVSDLRDVEAKKESGDKRAKIALDIYVKDIVKYIAEYYVELEGNVDGLIFTAGGGENAAFVRNEVVKKLSKAFHIEIDSKQNDHISRYTEQHEGIITTKESAFPVYVLPTDEEIVIARDTYALVTEKNKENKELFSEDKSLKKEKRK